ncbi:MAG: tRNA (adenosine(37)-N6)-dimethylallyltransferase MiaA [Defluviitaleaceae bacterium]|nr:tRNA (adenosine(37)-N6)-dimethylallyltransferase MiaA [Defluviitaleaceae bacterium]
MKPLVVIAGPTACGKTAASIELAKRLNGEIISADSMQIYKHMDIGTAKPMPEERQGIKHYLIDELFPDEEYSVCTFAHLARQYAREIYAKGKTPILVGGTGFYINAFINDTEFTGTTADPDLRERMYNMAREQGNGAVYEILRAIDPEACETIHSNNLKRVIRAIEFHSQTGKKISGHNREQKEKTGCYNTAFFVLHMPREKLYRRIEERVDSMIEHGLADEVRRLLDMGYSPGLTSMRGLGYKELIPYIQGGITLPQAIETLKRNTRHFAKRQITWFKHQSDGYWIDIDEFDNIDIMLDRISQQHTL